MNRRLIIKHGLLLAMGSAYQSFVLAGSKMLLPTPAETEGPFYPVLAQQDKDFDLTQVKGQASTAKGRTIWVVGRVLDQQGRAIDGAIVDIWQANAAGRYHHPDDSNPAPLDPAFQGWAITASGHEGLFRFKTVFPGIYTVAKDWQRPPHIHFKVSKPGYKRLLTQMYFPDHVLNGRDYLLERKTAAERQRMTATMMSAAEESYQYNIVLQADG